MNFSSIMGICFVAYPRGVSLTSNVLLDPHLNNPQSHDKSNYGPTESWKFIAYFYHVVDR